MPDERSRRSGQPDERYATVRELSTLREQVATVRAELAAERAERADDQKRMTRIWTGILAFVTPVTLALIAGAIEILLHLSKAK